MPYAVAIDTASHTARIHMSGILHGEDLVGVCRELFLHPAWERGFSTLWLTQDVESIHILPVHLESYTLVAGRIRALRGPGRSAVVTTHSNVEITARMLALKTAGGTKGGDRSTRVFKDVAAAEAWLATGGPATGGPATGVPATG